MRSGILHAALGMLFVFSPGQIPAAGNGTPGSEIAIGRVATVQLLDVSALGQQNIVLLQLAGGQSFQLPGVQHLSAGTGVEVEVHYLPADEASELPVACRIRVLAIPVEREGVEVLQRAQRAFEVYRNREIDSDC